MNYHSLRCYDVVYLCHLYKPHDDNLINVYVFLKNDYLWPTNFSTKHLLLVLSKMFLLPWGIVTSYKIVAILVTFLEFSEVLFIDQYTQMRQSELDYINWDTMLRLHMESWSLRHTSFLLEYQHGMCWYRERSSSFKVIRTNFKTFFKGDSLHTLVNCLCCGRNISCYFRLKTCNIMN